MRLKHLLPGLFFCTLMCSWAWAEGVEEGAAEISHGIGPSLGWIALILVAAKLAGRLVEKIGQPAVLGELVVGVIMGNLALIDFGFLEPIKHDHGIEFMAQIGVVILLFQSGLESNVAKMMKVGVPALLVAVVGVVLPFLSGYLIGPLLLPGLEHNTYLFLGATLTATSVGITARVFKDLNKLKTKEAQIVLGAAVIDDVLGLIILAVVSAIVTVGEASVGMISIISLKAFVFLAASILLGQMLAKQFGQFFAFVSRGVGMKITFALAFCFAFASVAQVIGLAPIVGAFAAGLVLDPVHFNDFKGPELAEEVKEKVEKYPVGFEELNGILEKHREKHVEDLIEPVAHFVMPIFFVLTGINVRLETLFDTKILLLAIGITVVAFIGKIAAGLAAGKETSKMIVGVGMIPRGEVGLIFATIGKALGVVDDQVFSIIVVMVILSTLIPPPILAWLLKRQDKTN